MSRDALTNAAKLAGRTFAQAAIAVFLASAPAYTRTDVLLAATLAGTAAVITLAYRLVRPLAPANAWGRALTTFLTAALAVVAGAGTGILDVAVWQGALIAGFTATLAFAHRIFDSTTPIEPDPYA